MPLGSEASWWPGGTDGGAYIKTEEDKNLNDNLYKGGIFFEHDKTVWYRGPFKLVGDIKLSINNHDSYLFLDGEKFTCYTFQNSDCWWEASVHFLNDHLKKFHNICSDLKMHLLK